MGFLVIFVVVFFLAAGAAINYTPLRLDAMDYNHAQALAVQMSTWHNAVVSYCSVAANCKTATPINPAAIQGLAVSPLIAGGATTGVVNSLANGTLAFPGFSSVALQQGSLTTSVGAGFFHSAVNPSSVALNNVVVTYYADPSGKHTYDGMIVAALTDPSIGGTYSQNIGFYDADSGMVDRAKLMSIIAEGVGQIQIPNTVGGMPIPDKAPVIVSQISK